MPLTICILFFIVLFSFEGACYLAGVARKEGELIRYQAVEHPRRMTSDRYLDLFG